MNIFFLNSFCSCSWSFDFNIFISTFFLTGLFFDIKGFSATLILFGVVLLASVLTRTVHSKTLPIGMMDYLDEFTINWAGMCAIAVVMIVPAVILTFIVQKHLVSGLTFGGVKG